MKLLNELLRAVRNKKYEQTESGMFFPGSNLSLSGMFDIQVNDGPVDSFPNLVVNEWRTRALEVLFLDATKSTTFYLAPYVANQSPLATWTAASFAADATEFTNYAEPTRPAWTVNAVDSFSVSNTANKAVFTIGAGAQTTIWGVGLLTSNAKGGVNGYLVAANRSAASRDNLQSGDEVSIGYTISLNASV